MNTHVAIMALLELKFSDSLTASDSTIKELLNDGLVTADPQYRITPRGHAWLAMILETPLPVQQWIDPRVGNGRLPDIGEFRGFITGSAESRQVTVRDNPMLELPAGFTPTDGISAPGIDLSEEVHVFRRNGKIARLRAGQVIWKHAVKPVFDEQAGAEAVKKAEARFAKLRGDDVLGFAVIPDPDAHLRREGQTLV